jgi:hypothetical protein
MSDFNSFEDLVRAAADSDNTSRRKLLRMLVGTAVGTAIAPLIPSTAFATKPECPDGRKKCKGMCCQSGEECCKKTLISEGGCTLIGTRQNCLACGDVCRADQACCDECRRLDDINHCGRCDNPCQGPDAACCSYGGSIGICLTTTNDPNNCGCCGPDCACALNENCCNKVCSNPLTDNDNCGTCGTKCSDLITGSSCVNGSCACPAGYILAADPYNNNHPMCCPNECLQPGGQCCFVGQHCVPGETCLNGPP